MTGDRVAMLRERLGLPPGSSFDAALAARVTTYTTIAGAEAAVEGMRHLDELHVYDLQGLHKTLH